MHNSICAQIRAFFADFGLSQIAYRQSICRFAKNRIGFEIIEFGQQSEFCNHLQGGEFLAPNMHLGKS